eukprot:6461413-Lingulodinium_polyedra.AAC.1
MRCGFATSSAASPAAGHPFANCATRASPPRPPPRPLIAASPTSPAVLPPSPAAPGERRNGQGSGQG